MNGLVTFLLPLILRITNKNAFGFDIKSPSEISRRDAVIIGVGGVAYAKVLGDAVAKLAKGDVRPAAHEDRVRETFEYAFKIVDKDQSRPLRVLELGIGSELRTLQRDLYSSAFDILTKSCIDDKIVPSLEFTGVDQDKPNDKVLRSIEEDFAKRYLNNISFDFVEGDAEHLSDIFPENYFDIVTCCLVLCSVNDQMSVLEEIKKVLKRNGAFAWVEHVAVRKDLDNGHSLLEMQQKLFDPLQQAVAHNCHLHRYTDESILEAFTSSTSQSNIERFFVEDMWPVSCQVRGVVRNP